MSDIRVNVALILSPLRDDAPVEDVLNELKGTLEELDLRVEVKTANLEEAYVVHVVDIEDVPGCDACPAGCNECTADPDCECYTHGSGA